MTRALLSLACVVAIGCDCSSFVRQRRFACSTDADCQEGFSCRDRGDGLECVTAGSAGGGSVAGGVAGGGEAGGGVAGGGDAGGVGGGDASAGGSTAGGSTAGGSTAGGSTAGGSTAGGSTAGGSTAGGSTAGGSTAGGSPAGGSPGPATALRFITAARSVPVATCSAALTIEPIDSRGVFSPTSTTISVGSSSTVRFFVNPTCSGAPASSVGVMVGAPRATFYAVGGAPGSFTVTASANGLMSDTQSLTVGDGPDTLVFTSPAPTGLKGGACFSAVLGSRRAGVAVAPASSVIVALGASAGAARFYSDPLCEVEVTSLVLASSAATIFVRALSSPLNRLQATVPLWTGATLDVSASPMVRRGSCSFDAQSPDGGADGGPGPIDTFAFCSQTGFAADASTSVVFLQTSTASSTFSDATVRCRINSSGSGLNCNRRMGNDAANVRWQVLEDPSRLKVGFFDGTCAASYTLSRVADLSRTFLVRAKQHDTVAYDDEDSTVFTFTDGGTMTGTRANCGSPFLQAVEWSGVSVTRGVLDGGMDAGVTELRASGLPSASTNRMVLLQLGVETDGMLAACSVFGRAFTTSPSEIAVRRAMGVAACATTPAEFIAFERIDFGNRALVQEFTATLPAGTTSLPVTISPVDPTRTVVLASGQTDFGQSGGESSDAVGNRPLEANFSFELEPPAPGMQTSTQVTVRRSRGQSSGAVTFYVLQAE